MSKTAQIFHIPTPADIGHNVSVTIESTMMSIALTPFEQVARMRSDLRIGAAVVLCAAAKQWMAAARDTITPERSDAMR